VNKDYVSLSCDFHFFYTSTLVGRCSNTTCKRNVVLTPYVKEILEVKILKGIW